MSQYVEFSPRYLGKFQGLQRQKSTALLVAHSNSHALLLYDLKSNKLSLSCGNLQLRSSSAIVRKDSVVATSFAVTWKLCTLPTYETYDKMTSFYILSLNNISFKNDFIVFSL